MSSEKYFCVDCADVSRRDFVKAAGGLALAGGSLALPAAQAAPTPSSAAETSVKALFESLSDKQKKVVCFPFDHKLRQRISANWSITKPRIGDGFYTDAQRKLIDKVVRGITSEDGYDRLQQQMKADWGGFGRYTMAIFGTPGSGNFEWEMTGRHLTMRADGDSVKNAAFGGPIVYGHGVSNPAKNLFYYQTKKVNEVFGALEGKQREKAALVQPPRESQVPIQGDKGTFPGIAVSEMSADQQKLVEETLKVLLAVYRKEDVDEVMAILKQGGGLKTLHMAFYTNPKHDLKRDKIWDVWRVEGPTFVWHFRGAPHVHAYINIGVKG